LFAADETRELSVELSTLDRFAAEQGLSEIDLIKCDVEGAELFVMRGGLRTLQAARPILMLEMLRKWAKLYEYHPNDILALLSPLGYHCFSLSRAGLVEHARIEDDTEPTNFFLLDPTRHAASLAKLAERFGGSPGERALELAESAEPLVSARTSTARLDASRKLALRVRRHALKMVQRARASHIGSCLSIADILAVLYASVLRVDSKQPELAARDRFILSKGHAAAALYAVLAEAEFFPTTWLDSYSADGSVLAGHVVHKGVPGVEVSTGSLGHGLSIGVGMALAASRSNQSYRTFVLLSDGECDEGAVWEAALFASQHRLDNLIAIVDKNDLQGFGRVSDVLGLEPFADKWRAFGWNVIEVSGHDHAALDAALSSVPSQPGKPTLLSAKTVKGKGVSFMEDQFLWHYRSPDADELARALAELSEPGDAA
jgi:transketolase